MQLLIYDSPDGSTDQRLRLLSNYEPIHISAKLRIIGAVLGWLAVLL